MRMKPGRRTYLTHHGYGETQISRYLVLYLAQAAWLVLGVFLYWGALWPSTCQPENIIKAYACSLRLPETHALREAALLTWMWGTPIMVLLELGRRYGKGRD